MAPAPWRRKQEDEKFKIILNQLHPEFMAAWAIYLYVSICINMKDLGVLQQNICETCALKPSKHFSEKLGMT